MQCAIFGTMSLVLIGAFLLLDMSRKMRNDLVIRVGVAGSDIVLHFYRWSIAVAVLSAGIAFLLSGDQVLTGYVAVTHDEQTYALPLLYIVYILLLFVVLSVLHIGAWMLRKRAHLVGPSRTEWERAASVDLNYVIAASTAQVVMLYIVS